VILFSIGRVIFKHSQTGESFVRQVYRPKKEDLSGFET